MRMTLLASAALFGMALAVPALARNHPAATDTLRATPSANTERLAAAGTSDDMSAPPGVSHHATNIGPSDMRGSVAPRLPTPELGASAGPVQYLQAAQHALQHHQGGMAQEAMERAETRLLDRATAPSAADQPDNAPAVQQITQALDALGRHDWQGAQQHLGAALQHAQMAESEGGTMTAPGGMGQQGAMMHQGQTSATSPMTGTGTAIGAGQGASAQAVPGQAPGMTAGQRPMPVGGVMAPNGGMMRPNGGVMPPSP